MTRDVYKPELVSLTEPKTEALMGSSVMSVLGMHLARNARKYIYFKVNALLSLVQSLAQLLVFLYMGRLLSTHDGWSRGTYESFLIAGMTLLQWLDKGLIGPYASVSGAYWSARLEPLLLAPRSLWLFVTADTVWYYLLTNINIAAIFITGRLFGARLTMPQDIPRFGLIVVLATLSVFGMGLMSASAFSLINAKGRDEPISWAVHLLQGLVSGLYFPFSLLPTPLQYAGLLLPHTYAIDGVRRLMVPRYGQSGPTLTIHRLMPCDPQLLNIFCLAICLVVYLSLGVYLFQKGMRKSQEAGSLSRWT